MNELMDRFKLEYPNCNKITYAGRLDPIAFGIVIILTDEDVHLRDKVCKYTKQYNFKLLKGFKTDTYDILGLITDMDLENKQDMNIELKQYIMPYPPYSSVPIKEYYLPNKRTHPPYWYCAKNNLYVENIPTKEITVHDFNVVNQELIKGTELLELIKNRINSVKKLTFRQDEIITMWESKTDPDYEYEIYSCNITLSSGGYVRFIGNELNSACFDIERTAYRDAL
jgi:tRNA U55 pseudouridine synthase TruB